MKTTICLLLACSAWFAACTFSPDLPGLGACEADGSCKVAGCVCLGGRVCVPETKGDDPVGCMPCETVDDCGEALAGPCFEMICEADKGACAQKPRPLGSDCSDGSLCTSDDACDGQGACGGAAVPCDHLDAGCLKGVCDEATGQCETQPAAAGDPCDDGLACTTNDACASGGLCAGAPLDCSELDGACTQGSCDEVLGDCVSLAINEGLPCDDGDPCSGQDSCDLGVCRAGPVDLDEDGDGFLSAGCQGGTDCDDGDAAVHPGGREETYGAAVCYDAVDNDCDGLVDRQEGGCDPVCDANGWCWENPLPTAWNLYGIHGTSDDNLWAVGELGTILHRSGGAWRQVNAHPAPTLYDVWVRAPGTGYAVGEGGTLLRLNGSAWNPEFAAGVYSPLYGVWGTTTDVWAVGAEGTLLNSEGGAWISDGAVTAAVFYDVGGLNAQTVLASGAGGETKRLNNGSWAAMDPPTSKDIHAVFGSADGKVWLAGDGGTLLRFEEGQWFEHSSGQTDWRGVWGAGLADLWLVGRGGALTRLQGGMTGISYPFGAEVDINAIWGTAADSVWAAAGPMIAHHDGEDWSGAVDLRQAHVLDLWAVSDFEVYAVGCMPADDGSCAHAALLQRKHGPFVAVNAGQDLSNRGALLAVHGTGPNDVWAVGTDGLILHKDAGDQWTQIDASTSVDLHGVWAAGPGEVWIVGLGGTILRGNANSGFVSVGENFTGGMLAIWGSGPGDVFVAGAEGMVHHHNGLEWDQQWDLGLEHTLVAGWSASAGAAWVVSDTGSVFSYAGGDFGDPQPLQVAWLKDVGGLSVDEVWVVGCAVQSADDGACVEPAIYHGSEALGGWLPVELMRTPALTSISFSPGGQVWVGGARGTVIRNHNGTSTGVDNNP